MIENALPPAFADIDMTYYLHYVSKTSSPDVLENIEYASDSSFSPIKKTVLLLKSDSIGFDDSDFGKKLMVEFLHEMYLSKKKPGTVILLNTAVKILESSTGMCIFSSLEKQSVKILICMTSAEKYKLLDKITLGSVVLMEEIFREIMTATKVISI